MEGGLSLDFNTAHFVKPVPLAEDGVEEIPRNPYILLQRLSSFEAPATARQERAPIRRRVRYSEDRGKPYRMLISTARSSMEGSDGSSSSSITVVTSATSSCTDPWSSSGFVEEEEDDGDFNWDQEEEMLLEPKVEPVDDVDMTELADIKPSAVPESPVSVTTPAQTKRPRGRPRKHPKPTAESMAKVAKGRSKTGCLTCRKRKKKCDETKPGCMNCEKNSVKCEGYPEKTIWKSGKEKAEEGRVIKLCQQGAEGLINSAARLKRAGSFTLSNIQLPPLINGLETEPDRMFFHHYITRLSVIFTLEGEQDSAFRNILLPLANENTGLMHGILALSSKHLDYTSAYGAAFLREHPNVGVQDLEERSRFHKEAAIHELVNQTGSTTATYGQIACFVLETLSDPKPNGQHRFHLQHYQRLIEESPPEENDAMRFFHEFFQYHIHADELIHLPTTQPDDVNFVSISEDFNLPSTVLQPSAVRLLGVFDGLFLYMSKITNIRNVIRQNIEKGIDPIVDYKAYYAAAEIDAGIRDWTPVWPPGDPRDKAGMLYRQMMWIYLWRTIKPPQCTNWKLDPHITTAVNDGIKLLGSFDPRDASQTLILAPAFVIGCACFEKEQREPIRKAIATVKAYMEYRNTDTALEVLEEVWRLIDLKDERSWDWQSIAHNMGIDFLAT